MASLLLGSLVMTTTPRASVVGVFENRLHANQAITELHQAGFTESQIGLAMRHSNETGVAGEVESGTQTEEGALDGAVTGLGLGTLTGIGVLAGIIPVVGPAIAAGTLGLVLSNAAAGAGILGLVGALVGYGFPEHEAEYYHDEIAAGRVIVTINAASRATEATAILKRNGAYDMSSRPASQVAQ